MTKPLDIAIVGGGIVGLATADAIRRTRADLSLTVLEKEPEVAAHQTGRNSGVIHAGLYYAPGSLKARLCTEGSARLFRYCAERGIATTRTGKIVVAMSRDQLPALDELERRGRANGVAMERIGPDGIAEREPRAGGIEALHVPATGAVDFGDVARALAADLARAGHEIRTGFEVREARRTPTRTRLVGPPGNIEARVVVNCAGLHVDRVMRLLGHDPRLRVLPFRGEYWSLSGSRGRLRARPHLSGPGSPAAASGRSFHARRGRTRRTRPERGVGLGSRGLRPVLRAGTGRAGSAELPRLSAPGAGALADRPGGTVALVRPASRRAEGPRHAARTGCGGPREMALR